MQKRVILSLLAVSFVLTVGTAPVLAVGDPSASVQTDASASSSDAASTRAAAAKAAAQARLTETKLKVCQNRQKAVTNIMTRIAERGQKHVDLFTTIAQRTEKFYTDKGKTLASYSTLVADVDTKKTAAQAAVDKVKTDSTSFTCDAATPKDQITSFKGDLQAEKAALQAYRTSVKNLIVGVKSVQGTTTSTTNKSTGSAQ